MISQVKSVKITAQNLKSIVLEEVKSTRTRKKKQFTRERLKKKTAGRRRKSTREEN